MNDKPASESPEVVTSKGIGSSALLGSVVRVSVNAAMSEITTAITEDNDLAHTWGEMSTDARVAIVKKIRGVIHESVQHVSDEIEKSVRLQIGGHSTSELWGPNGLLAATMRWIKSFQHADTVASEEYLNEGPR